MGQDISKAYTPPPLSFRDCLVDGRIDIARYMVYSQSLQIDEDSEELEDLLHSNFKKRDNESNDTSARKKARRTPRSIKRFPILCRADDGSLRVATTEDSNWFRLYIAVKQLVHHFDIRFKTNDLAWPKRRNTERKY